MRQEQHLQKCAFLPGPRSFCRASRSFASREELYFRAGHRQYSSTRTICKVEAPRILPSSNRKIGRTQLDLGEFEEAVERARAKSQGASIGQQSSPLIVRRSRSRTRRCASSGATGVWHSDRADHNFIGEEFPHVRYKVHGRVPKRRNILGIAGEQHTYRTFVLFELHSVGPFSKKIAAERSPRSSARIDR